MGLEACEDLTRACFLDAFRSSQSIDLGGVSLQYGPGDNQGSDAVIMTVIDALGRSVPVASLEGAS